MVKTHDRKITPLSKLRMKQSDTASAGEAGEVEEPPSGMVKTDDRRITPLPSLQLKQSDAASAGEAGEVEEPSTPRRSRSRSPDQADVQHADILGHVDQLKHAGRMRPPLPQPACLFCVLGHSDQLNHACVLPALPSRPASKSGALTATPHSAGACLWTGLTLLRSSE